MGQKPIFLSIPDPCQQNWEEMTPDNKGRFCSHCTKTVIDFTTYNDEQLLAFFNQKKSRGACGRFTGEQLEKVILPLPQRRFNWASKVFAGIALYFSGLVGNFAFSMNNYAKKKAPYTNTRLDVKQLNKTRQHEITGFVYDGDGLPVNEANVLCINNNITYKTDINGYFHIPYTPENAKTLIELIISKQGYTEVNYQSNYNDLPEALDFHLLYNPHKPDPVLNADTTVIKDPNSNIPKDTLANGKDTLVPRVITMDTIIIKGKTRPIEIHTYMGILHHGIYINAPKHKIVPIISDQPGRGVPAREIPDLKVVPQGPDF